MAIVDRAKLRLDVYVLTTRHLSQGRSVHILLRARII